MDNEAYIGYEFDDDAQGAKKYRVTEADTSSDESISYLPGSKSTLAQFLATSVISLSGVSLGLLYMISAIVIQNVYNAESGLSLNDEQVSWYASLLPITQPIGCVLGGYLQRYIGRVRGLVLMNVSTIIAWIVLYIASNATMLYLSSILMGMSIGFTEAPAIIYVAEIATPSLRGMFVSFVVCSCTFGISLIFFIALFMPWRTLCIFGIVLGVVTILAMAIIPDTPIWLINKNREKEALEALRWLRGWVSEEQVRKEFQSLRQQIKDSAEQDLKDRSEASSWKQKLKVDELMKASTLRPFILVVVYYFFACAAMTIGARSYYLVIFNKLNIPVNPTVVALFGWIAAVLGNISSSFLMRVLGKRTLSMVSMLLSSSLCILIGLYIAFQHTLNQPMIFVVLIICHGFSHYLGVSSISWILLGEIYPVKVGSLVAGITGAIFYVIIFVYVKTYYYLDLLLTTQGVFVFYGILGFIGLLYLWIFLPETEGKTLAEIEELFKDGARKKCSHFRKKK